MTKKNVFSISCLTFLIFSAASCAPNLGKTIDLPSIPEQATLKQDSKVTNYNRASFGSKVDILAFTDSRSQANSVYTPGAGVNITSPEGNITLAVEDALRKAFKERGLLVKSDAPLKIRGDVKKWDSKVEARVTASVVSTASLAIDVVNAEDKVIYTANYSGSKASDFPIVNVSDVQDSLGRAMAQAISQMLDDDRLLSLIATETQKSYGN